ncbi:centromere protein J-like [Nylanderia fulva]|uniref:centromere protein J-like n=1 Tax=Nylanderia fulva TaxID=613905 RepID=UPI0010FB07E2|nr:centromere protein J-like [Nylanderia fulva]XP_029173784.1 centromere protein J-like [Nylanderia fulva]XP_029173785.1 centromere protein J-like [Nylanderia fulva]
MDIEASIAERLEKLRQWQIEQQERLLKQQQMQREVLSNEQNRICKALGLTIHDLNDIIDNTENVMHGTKTEIFDEVLGSHCDMKNLDNALEVIDKEASTQNADTLYENCKEEESEDSDRSAIMDKNRDSIKRYNSSILSPDKELDANLLIEGIKPLSLDNAVSNKCIAIDDIPLPSPKKDFHTLLEERLKRESEAMLNVHNDAKTKPKKPFLKKGQGLSRFKISQDTKQSTTMRKHSMSFTPKHCINKSDKCRKSTVHKDMASRSPNNFVAGEKRQLSLKSVPLPRNKIITSSKQTAYVASKQTRYVQEMNASDSDSKMDREMEEMRIFELMEEKAKNSSFCSTSSTVLAFLQQSTPFKIKKGLNSKDSEALLTNARGQNDTIEQESTPQRSAHVENLKSRAQHQFKQFWSQKQSCINSTTDPYLNTESVSDMQERKLNTDGAKAHDLDVIAASSSDSDEEADISKRNDSARDGESSDANHCVRFSEYNEYRTIDLTDAADKSPLRDSLEQQNWNHSVETSESSDVEERLVPLNYGKQTSSLKVTSDKEAADVSRQLFLQENAHYRLTEADEEEEKDIYEDDNDCAMMEEIIETSDEEEQRSVLSSSSSSSSDVQRKKYILKSEPEKKLLMEKILKIRSNAEDHDSFPPEDRINRTNGARSFESELLKSRLLELEREIDIFRKESAALLLQRRSLQNEQTSLRKEYLEKERNFEENRRRVENRLEEEKKRLARERIAMENRVRDAQEKARQSKTERQKAQDLQEQLERLREDLGVRESRWNAAESRYKSEFRVLRAEVSKLKEEITTLRNVKRTNVMNTRKSGQMITRAINQINRRVAAPPSSREPPAKMMMPSRDLSSDSSAPEDKDEAKDRDKSVESIVKTVYLNDDSEQVDKISVDNKKVESKQVGVGFQPKCNKTIKFADESVAKKKQYLYENLLKDATSNLVENPNQSHVTRDVNDESKIKDDVKMQNRIEKSPSSLRHHRISEANTINKDIVKQIQYTDGRVEYWYPNGNVKKVFPDREITKMIYYNGDVRETDKDGRVKYFYATTKTWHTTTPDGLEILEFPDGQVEKRASDGTIEVSFPDGAVRIAQADGTEKWSLPDGTIAETFINGDKILTLPNGQREIHTKEHKRREYPDGTVKLVYTDGTQETRYSNGRKRLKDKDGNLLMDSYDN